jgi:putative alpha-1,2-mannosidase
LPKGTNPRWEFYNVLPDSTGNVGMCNTGNEPRFHIPYLYALAGEPWKTPKRIRVLLVPWLSPDPVSPWSRYAPTRQPGAK